jgi:hypothetical protein
MAADMPGGTVLLNVAVWRRLSMKHAAGQVTFARPLTHANG